MGWLEGALRIFPAWRIHLWNHTIPGAVLARGRPTRTHLRTAVRMALHRSARDARPRRAPLARSTTRSAQSNCDLHRCAHLLYRALHRRIARHLRSTPQRAHRASRSDLPSPSCGSASDRGGNYVGVVSRPFFPPLRRQVRSADDAGHSTRKQNVSPAKRHERKQLTIGASGIAPRSPWPPSKPSVVGNPMNRRRRRKPLGFLEADKG